MGLPEPMEPKHRDLDPDTKCRETVAERDSYSCREGPHGERDREKPRERRRDRDGEKRRDRSREQDVDKSQSRGKDRDKDREHQARREQPRQVAAHHNLLGPDARQSLADRLEHSVRTGADSVRTGPPGRLSQLLSVEGRSPLKRCSPLELWRFS